MAFVVPLIMAASAAYAAKQQGDASEAASDASNANLSIQSALGARQLELQQRNLNAQHATQVNARGDSVVYDPRTGTWTSNLSHIGRQQQEASDYEMLKMLTDEAAIRRQGVEANAQRRGTENRLSDVMLRNYESRLANPRDHQGETASAVRNAGRADNSAEMDKIISGLALQGVRSGQSGIDGALQKLGVNAGKSLNSVNANGTLQGMNAATKGDELLSSLFGNYNNMASRASNFNDSPVGQVDNSVLDKLGLSMRQLSGGAAEAGAKGLAYAGQGINTANSMIKPDYSAAQQTNNIGNTLAGLFKAYQGGAFDNMWGSRDVGNISAGKDGGMYGGTANSADWR
jgi:hypothetical protein